MRGMHHIGQACVYSRVLRNMLCHRQPRKAWLVAPAAHAYSAWPHAGACQLLVDDVCHFQSRDVKKSWTTACVARSMGCSWLVLVATQYCTWPTYPLRHCIGACMHCLDLSTAEEATTRWGLEQKACCIAFASIAGMHCRPRDC